MRELKIGELARRTGTNAPTIRYYESIGLLPPSRRQEGGQRSFDEHDERRLRFIRGCRELGFALPQVRAMAEVLHDAQQSCTSVRDMALQQLTVVRQRMAELRQLEQSLTLLAADCDAQCAGGPAPDCVIGAELRQRAPVAAAPGLAPARPCCG